jgi:hypothetical protein
VSSETREETDDDRYVHRPEAFDETGEAGKTTDESGLGRAGWLLVGVVTLTFLVIPGVIYLFPAAPGQAGVPFLVAMLALPFVPALLLGLVAVWTAVADRQ